MINSALLKFFFISVIVALGLGSLSFFTLRELNESSTAEVRKNMIFFMAQNVETGGSYNEAIQALHSHEGHRYAGTNLWVFSGKGDLLASSGEKPPVSWSELKKPTEAHDFVFHYGFLHLMPDLALIKLEGKENNFLLIEFRRPGSFQSVAWVQIGLLLFVVGVSFLIAMIFAAIYLRNKSKEARAVLSRLENGDLKARFEIKRTDEIGSLMTDFNRMASEIERLVHRVQETEMARKNLLEELSHDLRTPLTSLSTSAETLHDHWEEMPREEQKEFVSVIKTELGYFLHLIEDLFFIAAIGEPRYKKTTQKIDLPVLLGSEVRGRDRGRGSSKDRTISWKLICDDAVKSQSLVSGDPLLIQRLFRNAFDNAAKHAASSVTVKIIPLPQSVEVSIENDGNGISDEEIAGFGLYRKNRFQVNAVGHDVSLGLGSVIIKTILELHGGSFTIERRDSGANDTAGTRLNLVLPKNL